MNELIKECYEAIKELNSIKEEQNSPEYMYFSLETDGYEVMIKFADIILYYLEDNDLYYEEMNGEQREYTILQYLKIRFEEEKEKFLNIQL